MKRQTYTYIWNTYMKDYMKDYMKIISNWKNWENAYVELVLQYVSQDRYEDTAIIYTARV